MTLKLKEISAAHSPDSDDAFMFYALAQGKLDTGELKINRIAKDIQTLNQEALKNTYEVTAISFAVYPEICRHYFLTSCGASMGENYGPVLIANDKLDSAQLASARIAIPGRLTTAFLVLRLFQPNANFVEVPFDQIIEAVANRSVDAGLLIHEGQLTYATQGLSKLVDFGEWWHKRTGLPLPLGGNAIRKDLGRQTIEKVTKLLKESIVYALAHRQEALRYAMTFARDMSEDMANRYVGMYVNELTVDCGERGRQAVKRLFDEAFSGGLLKERIVPEFAD
ncbi:MAG: ABC transporter substrate-binding protein [Candidatus Melainabacteria bacterium]|nr:MAG: ABC transporter substrate-binding protein [Candidatus Melainabacteria bacterium]